MKYIVTISGGSSSKSARRVSCGEALTIYYTLHIKKKNPKIYVLLRIQGATEELIHSSAAGKLFLEKYRKGSG